MKPIEKIIEYLIWSFLVLTIGTAMLFIVNLSK